MAEEQHEDYNSNQTTFTFERDSSKQPQQAVNQFLTDSCKTKTESPNNIDYRFMSKSFEESNTIKKVEQSQESDENYSRALFTSPQRNKNRKQQTSFQGLSYLQLTSKLQSAYNKIATSKSTVKSTARSNKNLVLRFEQLQNKKKQEIRKLKEQRQLQTIKQVKKKPTINMQSQRLMKQIGYKPIYLRYEQIVQSKKKQLETYQLNRQKIEKEKEAEFFQEYKRHCKIPDTTRTYDKYYDEMVRWKDSKDEQNRQKQQKKRNQELQNLTFHPKLNEKTLKIVQFQQKKPIYQRGLVKQKTKPLYTFTPTIKHKPK